VKVISADNDNGNGPADISMVADANQIRFRSHDLLGSRFADMNKPKDGKELKDNCL